MMWTPERPRSDIRYLNYYEPPSFYVAVDPGQAADPSALIVLEEAVWIPTPPDFDLSGMHPGDQHGWVWPSDLLPIRLAHFRRLNWGEGRPADPPLAVRRIHRWPLRTPYHEVANDIARLLSLSPLAERKTVLAMDCTGVGAGVRDLLHQCGLAPVAILITAGHRPEGVYDEVGAAFHVPKGVLVMAAKLALEQRRLQIDQADPLAPALVSELQDFRYTITASANVTYSARSGRHDDILLSLAMACWLRNYYIRDVDAVMAAATRPAN